MSQYRLAVNPTTPGTGSHDPSAVLFTDGKPVFGVEEERFTRDKHAVDTFPRNAIECCLNTADITLPEVESVLITWEPKATARYDLRLAVGQPSLPQKGYQAVEALRTYRVAISKLESNLAEIETPVPPVLTFEHHRCHAASAFYPSGFDEALVLTIDGRGESDSTVVWRGSDSGLSRIRTYKLPNSLGAFYGAITEYLGYRMNNGEGKVMGLAPYGSRNEEVESTLRGFIQTGVDYDVTPLVKGGLNTALERLTAAFDRPSRHRSEEITDWHRDIAHVSQFLLEEIVTAIVAHHCRQSGLRNVALAGGVSLNCKMNKRVMELEMVDDLYIQPVAHDGGTAIGAGYLATENPKRDFTNVYLGPGFSTHDIETALQTNKIAYSRPDDLERLVAERLAEGALVGWFQGRLELGPRALGNRSILADSRTRASRDRVNKFVKHREEWRPFAPSMLESAATDYLVNGHSAPYMIRTFDVKDERIDDIPAVIHEADSTTRPQTVDADTNPRFHKLISKFEEITGIPVILNTSFNDHGEPIVATPTEALKDFYGMGLDLLVLGDFLVEKDRLEV